MTCSSPPLTGVRFLAFQDIQSKLSQTRSVYWDCVYSRALDSLVLGKWQPRGTVKEVVQAAIGNAKKTVNRRASRTISSQEIVEKTASKDNYSRISARLDVDSLLRQVSTLDRTVLQSRLAGSDDTFIAQKLTVSCKRIALLHHRAVRRLQQKVRRSDGQYDGSAG